MTTGYALQLSLLQHNVSRSHFWCTVSILQIPDCITAQHVMVGLGEKAYGNLAQQHVDIYTLYGIKETL